MIGIVCAYLFDFVFVVILNALSTSKNMKQLNQLYEKVSFLGFAIYVVIFALVIKIIFKKNPKKILYKKLDPFRLKEIILENSIINRDVTAEYDAYYDNAYYYLLCLLYLNEKKECQRVIDKIMSIKSIFKNTSKIPLIICLKALFENDIDKFRNQFSLIKEEYFHYNNKVLSKDKRELYNILLSFYNNESFITKNKLFKLTNDYLRGIKIDDYRSSVFFLNDDKKYKINNYFIRYLSIRKTFWIIESIPIILHVLYMLNLKITSFDNQIGYYYRTSLYHVEALYELVLSFFIVNKLYNIKNVFYSNKDVIIAYALVLLGFIVLTNFYELIYTFKFVKIPLLVFLGIRAVILFIKNCQNLKYDYYGRDSVYL